MGIGGGPSATGRARNELARLTGDLGEASVETLRLLFTELVANAVCHATAPVVELVVASTKTPCESRWPTRAARLRLA